VVGRRGGRCHGHRPSVVASPKGARRGPSRSCHGQRNGLIRLQRVEPQPVWVVPPNCSSTGSSSKGRGANVDEGSECGASVPDPGTVDVAWRGDGRPSGGGPA